MYGAVGETDRGNCATDVARSEPAVERSLHCKIERWSTRRLRRCSRRRGRRRWLRRHGIIGSVAGRTRRYSSSLTTAAQHVISRPAVITAVSDVALNCEASVTAPARTIKPRAQTPCQKNITASTAAGIGMALARTVETGRVTAAIARKTQTGEDDRDARGPGLVGITLEILQR